jgi:peptidyl-prolyl cis-trans isomerase B (cyclophilin B)
MDYKTYLDDTNPQITIKVKDIGSMTVELFPSVAPLSVNNMIALAENKYYENTEFHRVIKGFMIQGGQGKQEVKPIKGEFKSNGVDNPLPHKRGVISMARTMVKDSATSQFFIVHKDAPHLDGEYAAFGGLVDGFEVLDTIANVKTDHQDKPVKPIIIETIVVTKKG